MVFIEWGGEGIWEGYARLGQKFRSLRGTESPKCGEEGSALLKAQRLGAVDAAFGMGVHGEGPQLCGYSTAEPCTRVLYPWHLPLAFGSASLACKLLQVPVLHPEILSWLPAINLTLLPSAVRSLFFPIS